MHLDRPHRFCVNQPACRSIRRDEAESNTTLRVALRHRHHPKSHFGGGQDEGRPLPQASACKSCPAPRDADAGVRLRPLALGGRGQAPCVSHNPFPCSMRTLISLKAKDANIIATIPIKIPTYGITMDNMPKTRAAIDLLLVFGIT